MTADGGARRDPFTLFLVVACTALAVLVVLLALQNRSLKAQLSARASAPPADGLKAGDVVRSFEVVDAVGVKSTVAFPFGGKTLLLVFSSTCRACEETLPIWDRLIGEGLPNGVRLCGMQTDLASGNAAAPLATPALAFPVYGPAVPRGEPMTKFPFIPGAAVLDGGGRVLGAWFGVPTDAQIDELRAALR